MDLSSNNASGNAEKICALVPAAGFSRRMGQLKPLLPLFGAAVIERTVQSLQKGGIFDVVVVTGHEADRVAAAVKAMPGVRVVYNPRYKEGMFTSVQAGVAAIEKGGYGAFAMIPADCPLVLPETIRLLAEKSDSALILRPSCSGRAGHPCMIKRALFGRILQGEFPEGLRSLFSEQKENSAFVPVDDEGVLLDMDTPEAYQAVLDRYGSRFGSE